MLFRLVGDDIPHPIGSPQNDVVRQRIIDLLTQFGYTPQVQTAFECDEYGTCGTVKNVLARLDGTEKGTALLIAAHYDSVPAGPGASDDGAGAAAVLEVARALKSLPAPRNSVILMIDDGEEAGLLGARAFADFHPWAKEVRAALNVDARGSSGQSLMFETGSANSWAVRLFASHVAHPAANSISYAIYKMLPNDTDFTIFKAAGYQGLNFANIGDVVHYHTPLDNFQNASPATLQHHGDNVLPSGITLAHADLQNPPSSEAVYFDVFGRWIARWPAKWTLPLALIALLGIASQSFWLIRSGRLTLGRLLWGVAAWILAMLITAALGLIFLRIIRIAGALPTSWIAHSFPIRVAMWMLALSVVLTHGAVFARRAGFLGLWCGTWIWISLLSVVAASIMPGASYVLVVSSWVAMFSGLAFILRRDANGAASAIPVFLPLLATGITGFPLALMIYESLGARFLAVVAIEVALLLSPILPACADLQESKGSRRAAILGVPVLVTIIAACAASIVPAFSVKAPERLNVEYWLDADSGRAKWVINPDSGRLLESLRAAAKFQRVEKGPFPWDRAPVFVADASHLGLAAPTFTILESSVENGKHFYRALLRSERAAPAAAVFFPPDSGIDSVRMEDLLLPAQSERLRKYLNGWALYDCDTMPTKGVTVSFTLPVGRPIEVYAIDRTFRLPDEGDFLLKARSLTATPSQDGDVTLVSRRIQLIP